MGSFDEREVTDERVDGPVNANTKSIEVVFDLHDPEQAGKLADHRVAFGEAHTEVEPLVESKVVLKIYPGGAEELR